MARGGSHRLRWAACCALALSPVFTPRGSPAADGPAKATDAPRVDFNRQVRAVLSDKCFHCHGPDPKNRKAGLRLDV